MPVKLFGDNSGSSTIQAPSTGTDILLTTPNESGTLITKESLEIFDDKTPELGGELNKGSNTIGGTQQLIAGEGENTIDWRLGNHAKLQCSSVPEYISFIPPSFSSYLSITIVQHSSGNSSVVFYDDIIWLGEEPILTTEPNGIDIISLFFDGINYTGWNNKSSPINGSPNNNFAVSSLTVEESDIVNNLNADMLDGANLSLNEDLGNSDVLVPSQNAVKSYIDSNVLDHIKEIQKIVKSSTTVVDTFIYDTTKDPDGGAWRDKCQNTSWYNEPLNTSTRGKTRGFPAVVLVVAETDKVTLFDATQPDVPMWMVFDKAGKVVTSVAILNSVLCIGTTTGLHRFSFLDDEGEIIT